MPSWEDELIRVESLRKQFGDLVAVDDVSFLAKPGSIFGLLGPNGAGKSTTIGCISGLLKPGGGRVNVLGHDVIKDGPNSRKKLGVVPQEIALYEDLSANENLLYWGAAYGLRGAHLKRRVKSVLELAGLIDRAKEPVKKYSGGLKRRLNFAAGIVHQPEALLLDEPTVGVDPQSRVALLDLVREQAAAGATVIYTTHYMEEAEKLCDELAIIDHGKIIAMGTLSELRTQIGERDVLRVAGRFDPKAVTTALAQFDDLELVHADDDTLTIAVPNASKKLSDIISALATSGFEVRETTLTQPSLESLFIKLTGKELRE
ncbi:MAG: ATP-binding cassette domain-containing protein [Candidatus Latescibacterota bacterium]|nr:MAG: ATP-binding cassette domain-containing protein [Candidatus Latescibacterota bacterium]